MWPNPQETADLVTFTEEIPNGKLHFLCSVKFEKWSKKLIDLICFNITVLQYFSKGIIKNFVTSSNSMQLASFNNLNFDSNILSWYSLLLYVMNVLAIKLWCNDAILSLINWKIYVKAIIWFWILRKLRLETEGDKTINLV